MSPFTTTISNRPIPAVGGAEHTWVRVRGARLHITAFGHGEPILLVHGFPQHWYAWRKVVDRLRGDYRLLCVDLRGFGWSEQTKRGYDLDGVATDLLRLLDALGLQQTGLVAHNWSAQAGFRLCLRAPERIAGHLALNTMHPWPRHRRMLPQPLADVVHRVRRVPARRQDRLAAVAGVHEVSLATPGRGSRGVGGR